MAVMNDMFHNDLAGKAASTPKLQLAPIGRKREAPKVPLDGSYNITVHNSYLKNAALFQHNSHTQGHCDVIRFMVGLSKPYQPSYGYYSDTTEQPGTTWLYWPPPPKRYI